MATSRIQHDVDMQETEQPQRKRRRLAGDGESYAERPQTPSEFKAAGIQQHGSQFAGRIAAGSHSYVHQGNIINKNVVQNLDIGVQNISLGNGR